MSWLLRLDAAQADAALRDEHRSWLAGDPLNALAWQQACKGWMLVGKLEPATRAEWPRKAPAPGASGTVVAFAGRGRRPAVWIAAAAAACLLLVTMPAMLKRIGADYATSTAESRTVSLADGTRVQLAPDSAFSASLTAQGRIIKMSSGRAFFDVAKDAARPFVVQAGNVSITVLGTAFDVRVSDEAVAVAVQHGRVGVQRPHEQAEERLLPGDQVTIDRATGAMVAETIPEAAVGSWTEGRLSVLNMPVAEVVAELRRYHRGWIVIADDRLAAERVTGVYNLHSPDLALAAMIQPVGGTMRHLSPFLTILSKPEK